MLGENPVSRLFVGRSRDSQFWPRLTGAPVVFLMLVIYMNAPGLVAVSFSKELPFTGVKTTSNPALVIGLVSESRISVLTVTGSTMTAMEQVLVPRLALLTVTDTYAVVGV